MYKSIPISEARRRFPELVRDVQRHPEHTYEISVHQEPAAIIASPPTFPRGGEAARSLLEFTKKFQKRKAKRRTRISENVDRYIYVKDW